jgi:hypothetical protein
VDALLFADRPGRALRPLSNRTAAALLPVAGKPLVVHALEALAAAGVKRVLVVVSPHAEAVTAALGGGERWGMTLEWASSLENESADAVEQRLGTRLAGEYLSLRGDVLFTPFLSAFLEGAAKLAGAPSVAAVLGGAATGVRLVRAGAPRPLGLLGDPEAREGWRDPAGTAVVEVEGAVFSAVESLAAFHRASLDAAAGRFPGLVVPGQEVAVGVRTGRRTRLPLRTVRAWPVFAGDRCRVDAEAELLGEVVLCDDVYVDRRASLKSTVVLPHSYVGELVELENAIVWTNDLVRIDTGAVATVTDRFLLADLRETPVRRAVAGAAHRVVALVLLVLTLPLWPIGLLASLFWGRGSVLSSRRVLGNRNRRDAFGGEEQVEFTLYRFSTSVPLLAVLPGLVAAVAGHLRVFGVRPLTADESAARTEDWERVRDLSPIGLVGPAQLEASEEAPEEEKLVVEGFWARARSGRGGAADAAWIFRKVLPALFSRRAWR